MRIFLSSTYVDLRPEREAVALALERLGAYVVGQEDRVPLYRRPLHLCLSDVESAAGAVFVIARRYGSLAPETGSSFVESEYDHAVSCGIPRFVFELSDDSPWHDDGDRINADRLAALRRKIRKDVVEVYSRHTSLHEVVYNSFSQHAAFLAIRDGATARGRGYRRSRERLKKPVRQRPESRWPAGADLTHAMKVAYAIQSYSGHELLRDYFEMPRRHPLVLIVPVCGLEAPGIFLDTLRHSGQTYSAEAKNYPRQFHSIRIDLPIDSSDPRTFLDHFVRRVLCGSETASDASLERCAALFNRPFLWRITARVASRATAALADAINHLCSMTQHFGQPAVVCVCVSRSDPQTSAQMLRRRLHDALFGPGAPDVGALQECGPAWKAVILNAIEFVSAANVGALLDTYQVRRSDAARDNIMRGRDSIGIAELADRLTLLLEEDPGRDS